MPRLSRSVPKYRKHRASGQAVVTLNGRDFYLGPHGTKASKVEYDRLIAEWLANGRVPDEPAAVLTVVELAARYLRFAKGYYQKNGKCTGVVPGHQGRIELRPRQVRSPARNRAGSGCPEGHPPADGR